MKKLSIYVMELENFNNGNMDGVWFDLPCSTEEVYKQVGKNYIIADYESDFPVYIGGFEKIEFLNGLVCSV